MKDDIPNEGVHRESMKKVKVTLEVSNGNRMEEVQKSEPVKSL